MPDTLTPASEKLLRDFDKYPDAIDYSELSARLWMIERALLAHIDTLTAAAPVPADGQWAVLDSETGDWLEVNPGVVFVRPMDAEEPHDA